MQRTVKAIADRHHGVMTWTYSQASWATIKHTLSNPRTRKGICAALVANWIKEHAQGGILGNSLTDVAGNVNVGKLLEIAAPHSAASATSDQEGTLALWLHMHGIARSVAG